MTEATPINYERPEKAMNDNRPVGAETSKHLMDKRVTPEANELGLKARSGVLWVTALNVFRDVLQFGTMLILVRLLEPKAYGEFAFVSSIMLFFTVLSFRSFLEQTLQLRPSEEVDYQSHFTAGGVIQGSLFGLLNATAVVLRYSQKYAEIAPYLHVMSLFFFFDWLGDFRLKMLQRDLNWTRMRILEAIGLIGSAGFGIALALFGYGAYALILPIFVMALPFAFDLLVLQGWRPNWSWSACRYRPAWRYGLSRIASGVLTASRPVIESAVVVHMGDFFSLGILGRAVGLAAICCQKVPFGLMTAIFPVLTRLPRNTASYSRANTLILRLVAWIAVPAAVLFSLIAVPVVRLIYGSKWDAAIPILPWALVGGVVAALYQTTTMLLLADLQQNRCVVAEVISLLGSITCLMLLLPLGMAAYLCGLAAFQALILAWMIWALSTGGAIRIGKVLREIGTPAAICIPIGLVLRAIVIHGFRTTIPIAAVIILSGGFAILYVLGLRLLSQAGLSELIEYCPLGSQLRRVLWL